MCNMSDSRAPGSRLAPFLLAYQLGRRNLINGARFILTSPGMAVPPSFSAFSVLYAYDRTTTMASSSRPVLVVLASSSLIICAAGLMRWRARSRAEKVSEKARKMCTVGPMVRA